ncbi:MULTISPECIES: XRE family transcriptional regulator [unclassified Pseudomonas]|uniref:XRE family transcriptional regulator n=1 Tax=unclassified Pseudomonas TaxID=196821 RepID=UPI000AF4D906|nr:MULTISPECIES: XRE family transcriptional regulator [unclassified Pseudomonas]MCR8935224.1 helix-turn-helix domain-containing protein [Pseudomonas sp. S11A4]MCR8973487.1 helix-turn-helix domain-containing protein [Pseudomonas sp. S11P7]
MDIEKSTGNVYEDLALEGAEEMLTKSEYATRLAAFIKTANLRESEAAQRIGITSEVLRQICRGKFRELSVATMAEYHRRVLESSI